MNPNATLDRGHTLGREAAASDRGVKLPLAIRVLLDQPECFAGALGLSVQRLAASRRRPPRLPVIAQRLLELQDEQGRFGPAASTAIAAAALDQVRIVLALRDDPAELELRSHLTEALDLALHALHQQMLAAPLERDALGLSVVAWQARRSQAVASVAGGAALAALLRETCDDPDIAAVLDLADQEPLELAPIPVGRLALAAA